MHAGGFFFDVGLLGPCKYACRGRRGRAKDVASMPRTLQSMPRTLPSMPRSCQASLHILGSHTSIYETWWYTTPLASQLRCGTPRTLRKGMPRRPRTLQACLGRCKACLGRCKACRGRPRTLPSMPRSCQASLHILGSHTNIFQNKVGV